MLGRHRCREMLMMRWGGGLPAVGEQSPTACPDAVPSYPPPTGGRARWRGSTLKHHMYGSSMTMTVPHIATDIGGVQCDWFVKDCGRDSGECPIRCVAAER